MIALALQEAQLMRLLQDIFGFDRVMPFISLVTVCGGVLPRVNESKPVGEKGYDAGAKIAPKNRSSSPENQQCLFTIVDHDHEPKLVVEFAAQNGQTIDALKLTQQQFARDQLEAKGIHYVLINELEFENILDPAIELSLANFIHSKILNSKNVDF